VCKQEFEERQKFSPKILIDRIRAKYPRRPHAESLSPDPCARPLAPESSDRKIRDRKIQTRIFLSHFFLSIRSMKKHD
jgi:hypothetical protein